MHTASGTPPWADTVSHTHAGFYLEIFGLGEKC